MNTKIKALFLLFIILAHTHAIANEIWTHDGSEFDPITLKLLDNGTATFTGGLTWYNPARWERSEGRLIIHIKNIEKNTFEYMLYAMKTEDGCIEKVNTDKIIYNEVLCNDVIDFGGYYFYKTIEY